MEDNHSNETRTPEPVLESGKDTEEKPKESRKEKRKAKRAARKEAFKALGPKKKACYIGKRLIAVSLLAALIFGTGKALYMPVLNVIFTQYWSYLLTQEVTREELLEMAPVDQKLSGAVDAMKPYRADVTWAVYAYMCGSNLEGGTMNNLSEFSKNLLATYSQDIQEKNRASRRAMLWDYMDELTE